MEAFAKFERERIRERVVAGLQRARAQGKRPGLADPHGGSIPNGSNPSLGCRSGKLHGGLGFRVRLSNGFLLKPKSHRCRICQPGSVIARKSKEDPMRSSLRFIATLLLVALPSLASAQDKFFNSDGVQIR